MSNQSEFYPTHPVSSRRRLSAAIAAVAFGLASGSSAVLAQEEKRGGYSLVLEEVVVTAQKREENFMTVPITVNAFTAQDMINTGAVNIQDIDDFMPGVEVGDNSPTQVGITVRGVSSPNISSGQDPSVATFYDGSYMPRAASTIPFTDIARTEVLKGPQGTLFGRNATAGVINIVPNRPHQEFEGFVKSRIGNYSLLRLEGMVNAPITDKIAVRANVFSHRRDGITENVGIGDDVSDENFWAARAAVLFTPTDRTEIQFSYDMEDRDEMPRPTIGVGKYAYLGSTDPFLGKTKHDVAAGQEETRDMYGVALQFDHEFNDQLSLFGIVSYRDWETTNLEEEDGTADPRRYLDTNNIEESDILYTEFRFNYVNERINLIGGFNYSEEEVFQRTDVGLLADSYMQFLTLVLGPEFGLDVDQDSHVWFLLPPDDATYLFITDLAGVAVLPPSFEGEYFTETIDNSGDFTNWGVFSDVTYQLTDTIRLAAGLRYSYDEKDYSWQTYPSGVDWPLPPARVTYEPAETGLGPENYFDKFVASDDWSKTTGRLVADWEFSDDAMTYLSYATGYKSGGFDGQSFGAVVAGSFAPEEMTSIEWGVKADFLDNSLRVETAVFHQELDGRQNQVDTKDSPDDPTAKPSVISSDEETDGIELIVTWNILDTLRFTGLTTYRETESISERYFNAAGEPAGGDKDRSETDNSYTLRLDWTPEIPMGFLLVHVDYVFSEDAGPNQDTAIFFGPGEDEWYFQDKKLLSARIAWQNDQDNIEVALWGKNLLDEEYAGNPGGFVADTLGAAHTSIDDPLTWGVDLRYSF